jgi:hypothetical protein
MSAILRSLLVSACGLATALLTGALCVLISRMTGFSIHTFSFWYIVPGGAFVTGFAAATGFYLGSVWLHARATLSTLVQALVVSCLAFFLIHWLGYATLTFEDGTRAMDVIGFGTYLDAALTQSRLRHIYQTRGGVRVGGAGYFLGALQLGAFLVGAVAVYRFLRNHPYCARCDRFLRKLGERAKQFVDRGAAVTFREALGATVPGTAEFARLMARRQEIKAGCGAFTYRLKLFGCPTCNGQFVHESFEVFDGRMDWTEVPDLARVMRVPAGTSVVRSFE